MPPQGPRLILDRYEGALAVLVDEEGTTFDVPAAWLPPTTSEGDGVHLTSVPVDDLREETEARLARLRQRAVKGPLKL